MHLMCFKHFDSKRIKIKKGNHGEELGQKRISDKFSTADIQVTESYYKPISIEDVVLEGRLERNKERLLR